MNGQLNAPAALSAEKEPRGQEAGWALEPIWIMWGKETFLSLMAIEPRFLVRISRSLAAILTELSRLKERRR
jgi:hypothetical protein